ncbi:MAG: hypothetical protein QOJ17_2455, partial [Rhodospirillaceae bacterium]|nr:hypothetical protein [Rhodospirillaceae bacterium]
MLKILAVIVVVVLVVIAGVLIYASTRPDSFRVQRSASIKAPPQKIFPLIDDLKAWVGWSPYEKKDPAMKRSFGPITAGKGATYEWAGDKNVGQGRMEILEAQPSSKVLIKLDFIKPFEAHNMAEFTLEPKGDTTQVTWAIFGPSAYITKVMGLFFNMDTMI